MKEFNYNKLLKALRTQTRFERKLRLMCPGNPEDKFKLTESEQQELKTTLHGYLTIRAEGKTPHYNSEPLVKGWGFFY